jgi:hypothetical protein
MSAPSSLGEVLPDDTGGAGVLQQDAKGLAEVGVARHLLNAKLDAQGRGPGPQDVQGGRKAVSVGEEDVPGVPRGDPPGQGHRLGGGTGLIEQGGVRHRERGEVGHHRLVVEQGLQPALGDLRLVRGIGRVPGGALQDVAADHRGRDRVEEALADHRGANHVAIGQAAQLDDRLHLGERRRKAAQALGSGGPGQGLRHQLVE